MSSASVVAIGETVSHYRTIEQLGAGGMGIVFKARDTRLQRFVALKFLPSELARDPHALERFRHEAIAASALNHPNLCTIYDIGEHQGHPFIAMEYLDGMTLNRRIGRRPLDTPLLLSIAIQIAEGLDAAHAAGIVHRDIKPGNILILRTGHTKILDFGLAKMFAATAASLPSLGTRVTALSDDKHLTKEGATVGTLSYMSPEQILGTELDHRTDLFSFGVVLYEGSTGTLPFTGDSLGALLNSILHKEPSPAVSLNNNLPGDLERIIQRALEKDRNLRYQSAKEIRSDLKRVQRELDSGRTVAYTGTFPDDHSGSPTVTPAETIRTVKWQTLRATHVKIGALMVTCVAIVVIGLLLWRSRHIRQLTSRDTVVVTDFLNATGERVFDETLKQGLTVQLQQSPFLNLVSDRKVNDTLKLMGHKAGDPLSGDVTRDVCQRTGSKAMLTGSIAKLGGDYVLGLKAEDCASGDLLVEEQVTANTKEQVLSALGHASTRVREKLGESLASIKKYDTPLESVTTPSLEALQAFSLGHRAYIIHGDFSGAAMFFERAIALDPNFAMAYAALGTTYNNLGKEDLGSTNLRKAYELRDRVSEREKFSIIAHYENSVTGNLSEAQKIEELWFHTYPLDRGVVGSELDPASYLGVTYSTIGDYKRALTAYHEALRINPDNGFAYAGIVWSNLALNHLDDARAVAEEAVKNKLKSPQLDYALYGVYFVQHNFADMQRQIAELMGESYEEIALQLEADTAAYAGRFKDARQLTKAAIDSAEQTGGKGAGAEYEAEAALREALAGNVSVGARQAKSALASSNGRNTSAIAALALALSGNSGEVAQITRNISSKFPLDTIVQSQYLPMIQAAMTLGTANGFRKPDEAIRALSAAIPYELGSCSQSLNFSLYPAYFRGQLYLLEHESASAVSEFQKITEHPGVVVNEPIGALAYLGLARAYRSEAEFEANTSHEVSATSPSSLVTPAVTEAGEQGALQKSVNAYENFFALWGQADSDIPILIRARQEYRELKQRSAR